MSKLVPHHDKVVLKKIERKKDSSIVIRPDLGKDRSSFYEVVRLGPGMYDINLGVQLPMGCEVGQVISISEALLKEHNVDGDIFYTTRDIEIHAHIEED